MKRHAAYIAALIGLVAVMALIVRQGSHDIVEALRTGGWALFVLIPLHLLPQIPDAAGWRVLINGPRTFGQLYWIAWIRQAVGRLMPISSIGGELVGIRLLVRGGIAPAPAIASVVVEVLSTMLGQFFFVLIGIACMIRANMSIELARSLLVGLAVCALVLAALVVLLQRGSVFAPLHRLALSFVRREPSFAGIAISERIDAEIVALCRSWSRLTSSTILQLFGMLIGCLEVWAAYALLGAPLSLPQAILVESLSQAAKHLIFFIPGGLGVQELTFVALSPLLGVSPDVSLAVSLTKRAVDVAVGVPALLSWQWSEGRHWLRRRRGS